GIVAAAQQEFTQIYPADGWVEHDPETIWSVTLVVARRALQEAEQGGGRVTAIGITNQRETCIVWDRRTGKPVYHAIVWQDRRTADWCRDLAAQGAEPDLHARSGLLLDPYFSSTKLAWILDHVSGTRALAEAGHLAFGTVDSFLIWRLTAGREHVTDVTNASRTNLFNIHNCAWDPELLRLFAIPAPVLPRVLACADAFGHTDPALFGRAIPILGVAGDQQAAAIGQGCFSRGDIKGTYGTGCFILTNTGPAAVSSRNRLLTTIAWRIGGRTHYALEGSIFSAGAAVQWLRDGLGVIGAAADTEALARGVANNAGVYLVPAFTGLGAPYWDPDARGAVFGLTRATGPAHFARAALEAVVYQTRDLLRAMGEDGIEPARIRVDGGMAANDWLLQFLADILAIEVDRPRILETTALGAAYLAGLQSGLYRDTGAITRRWRRDRLFTPRMPAAERERLLAGWDAAVRHVLTRKP
ncbi:MAG TPA: glycerol kinase GlpK, partial [Paracoccaceae bacterium]